MYITKILEGIIDLSTKEAGLGFCVLTEQGEEHFIEAPAEVVQQLVSIVLSTDQPSLEEVETEQEEVEADLKIKVPLPQKDFEPQTDVYADPITGVSSL